MRFLPAARHHGNQIILADAPELAMAVKLYFAKKMLGFCKKPFTVMGEFVFCLNPLSMPCSLTRNIIIKEFHSDGFFLFANTAINH
jgi:hypothetical protein